MLRNALNKFIAFSSKQVLDLRKIPQPELVQKGTVNCLVVHPVLFPKYKSNKKQRNGVGVFPGRRSSRVDSLPQVERHRLQKRIKIAGN